jgi:hypothetical protein
VRLGGGMDIRQGGEAKLRSRYHMSSDDIRTACAHREEDV